MTAPAYDTGELRKHIEIMRGEIGAHTAAIAELTRRIAEYEKCLAVAEAVQQRRDGRPG